MASDALFQALLHVGPFRGEDAVEDGVADLRLRRAHHVTDALVSQNALFHSAQLGDGGLAVEVGAGGDELDADGGGRERLEGVAEHEELDLGVDRGAVVRAADPGSPDLDAAVLGADVHERGAADGAVGRVEHDRERDGIVDRVDRGDFALKAADAPLGRMLSGVTEELRIGGGEQVGGVSGLEWFEPNGAGMKGDGLDPGLGHRGHRKCAGGRGEVVVDATRCIGDAHQTRQQHVRSFAVEQLRGFPEFS